MVMIGARKQQDVALVQHNAILYIVKELKKLPIYINIFFKTYKQIVVRQSDSIKNLFFACCT